MPATSQEAPNSDNDGVTLRPMTDADLAHTHALSAELRWPHRPQDWEAVFRHAEGFVAERDGRIVASALRWHWGERHATLGLIIVTPACQGRRVGHRLMMALLDGLDDHTVLLHATVAGQGLYERLGFQRIGEVRQHQGIAQQSPPVELEKGWRLRPAGANDAAVLAQLDAAARGMPRDAFVADLLRDAETTVILVDEENEARGFGMLRRFGRGHVIGPVVAPDAQAAKTLIAYLAAVNAGNFTRIDIDFDSRLAEWIESIGLLRVDAPTTMVRGAPLAVAPPGGPTLFAIASQAVG
jgi:predicted N-acetyltransferase YhbS